MISDLPFIPSSLPSLSVREGGGEIEKGAMFKSVNLDLPFCTKTTLRVITRALLLLMMHTWLFEMFLKSKKLPILLSTLPYVLTPFFN